MNLNKRNRLGFWNAWQLGQGNDGDSATNRDPKRPMARSSILIGTLALGFFLWSLFQFVSADGVGAASTIGIKPQMITFDLLSSGSRPPKTGARRSERTAAALGEPSPTPFGIAETDWPNPVDFDGDLKADIAIYRAATSLFSILRSSDGIVQNVQFGGTGDQTVTADFDGDGKADPAVFRCQGSPSMCFFSYLPSSQGGTNPVTVQWGTGTNQGGGFNLAAVPGDFDGDGKEDFCVYMTQLGQYRILRSSDSQTETISFGVFQSDWILTGDYDGDGRSDFITARTGNGPNVPMQWNVLTRSGGGTGGAPIVLGVSSDFPVLGDYDGDGKTDLAVWRNGTPPTLHVRRSSDGTIVVLQFGQQGDFPVGRWRNV